MTMALTQVNSNGISDNSIVNADINSAANIASTKLAKPIDLADNELIRLGTGSDLQIFHSGANSHVETSTSSAGDLYIVSQGSNHDLYLQATDDIFIRPASGDNGIRVLGDSAVELYHNNSNKLQTKSDGVNISGECQCTTLDVDGNADINGELSVNRAVLRDNNANSPTLQVRTDDTSPWAIAVGNDTYSTTATVGWLLYQADDGGVHNYIRGYSEYANFYIKQDNGTTTNTAIHCDTNRAVHLNHQGNVKLSTKSDGIEITGELECDTLDCDGSADFAGDVDFRGGAGAIQIAANSDIRFQSGNWTGDATKIQHHGTVLYIQGSSSGIQFRHINGTDRCHIDGNGHFLPNANQAYDLGSSSLRWRNLYTNDLNLSNEGGANDVDGTWGNYTIQEGEDDLFLINRRSGKRYKFNLTEVS